MLQEVPEEIKRFFVQTVGLMNDAVSGFNLMVEDGWEVKAECLGGRFLLCFCNYRLKLKQVDDRALTAVLRLAVVGSAG
jgi:hypothetical protein